MIVRIGSRIEVLRDDGLPVRVEFASLPPNLRFRRGQIGLSSVSAGERSDEKSLLMSAPGQRIVGMTKL